MPMVTLANRQTASWYTHKAYHSTSKHMNQTNKLVKTPANVSSVSVDAGVVLTLLNTVNYLRLFTLSAGPGAQPVSLCRS